MRADRAATGTKAGRGHTPSTRQSMAAMAMQFTAGTSVEWASHPNLCGHIRIEGTLSKACCRQSRRGHKVGTVASRQCSAASVKASAPFVLHVM